MAESKPINRHQEVAAKPTPDQMFELARAYKVVGRREGRTRQGRDRWRTRHTDRRVHDFMPKSVMAEELTDDEFRFSEYRLAGSVAYLGAQKWSMRMSERYHLRGEDKPGQSAGSNGDGYRITYKFEWTKLKVLVAQRHINAQYKPDEVDRNLLPGIVSADVALAHDIGKIVARETAVEITSKIIVDPGLRAVAREFERISYEDCEALIDTVRTFGMQDEQMVL